MSFIDTVPEESAEGGAATMYARTVEQFGFVPNFVKTFSHRPEVMDGFDGLLDGIKKNMDLRRYELVTIAAAKELKSSYCMLAHGSVLMQDYLSAEQLRAIADDPAGSALDEADQAIMRFAAKVVRDATSVTLDDIDGLKQHGLSDAEIFDVASAAAVRCFIAKTADALGARPDSKFGELEPELLSALVVGRPIAD